MTTPELERRLTDLLRERAEGAMERTDTQEKLSSILIDGERGLQRRRWAVAGGLVAAAAVTAAVWLGRGDADRTEPAPVGPLESVAVSTATNFLEATYAYDLDRAEGLLAPSVHIADARDVADWRKGMAWPEVAGYSLADHSCEEMSTSSTGAWVQCIFELNALGSEQLGKGPYGGNTVDMTVLDGKITRVEENLALRKGSFYPEMWEPFGTWVTTVHPRAVSVMYRGSSQSIDAEDTPRSLRLWERYVAEYVETQL